MINDTSNTKLGKPQDAKQVNFFQQKVTIMELDETLWIKCPYDWGVDLFNSYRVSEKNVPQFLLNFFG